MKIEGNHGDGIGTMEEWKEFAKPAADYHWTVGRSAYELAADWLDGNAEARTHRLISEQYPDAEFVKGVAEKKTSFDRHGGNVRNHDLLIQATCDSGNIVVGVEAKADETFGLSLVDQRREAKAALKETPGSKRVARLDTLTRLFLEIPAEEIEDGSDEGAVGYQLLTALAGTLADAKTAGAQGAVLLVHEFVTGKTDPALQLRNQETFEGFLRLLSVDPPPETDDSSNGWITSPREIKGDGDKMPELLPVCFAKLVTEVPPSL